MKKTIVFAIVLALVFAIAAPAFAADVTFTSAAKLGAADGFRYTNAEGKVVKVENTDTDLLIAEISVNTADQFNSGIIKVTYETAELTYVGFSADGALGTSVVNDTTAGEVKNAFASAFAVEAEGVVFSVAFSYDHAAVAGKTVKVNVEIPELLDEDSAAVEVAASGCEYTFANEAPVSEAPVSEAPVSEAPVSEAPVSEAPVSNVPVVSGSEVVESSAVINGSEVVTPGKTGAASLAAVAVISVVAGLGAIAFRKDA